MGICVGQQHAMFWLSPKNQETDPFSSVFFCCERLSASMARSLHLSFICIPQSTRALDQGGVEPRQAVSPRPGGQGRYRFATASAQIRFRLYSQRNAFIRCLANCFHHATWSAGIWQPWKLWRRASPLGKMGIEGADRYTYRCAISSGTDIASASSKQDQCTNGSWNCPSPQAYNIARGTAWPVQGMVIDHVRTRTSAKADKKELKRRAGDDPPGKWVSLLLQELALYPACPLSS